MTKQVYQIILVDESLENYHFINQFCEQLNQTANCFYQLDWLNTLDLVNNLSDSPLEKIYIIAAQQLPLLNHSTITELKSRCRSNSIIILVDSDRTGANVINAGATDYLDLTQLTLSTLERSFRLAKLALNRSTQIEANFQAIFEQAGVGIALLATSGQFLRVNRRLCQLLGYSEAELCSLTFQDLTYVDDLQASWEYVEQILSNSSSVKSLTKRYICKNGHPRWVNITASLIKNSQDYPLYLITIVEDFQESKQTEEKLQHRLILQQALAKAAKQLTGQEKINFTEILAWIGIAVGTNHAYFATFATDNPEFDGIWQSKTTSHQIYHWWDSQTTEPTNYFFNSCLIENLTWFQEQFKCNQNIIISDLKRSHELNQQQQDLFKSLEICSLLAVPVYTPTNQLWGIVGLDTRGDNYKFWSEEEVQLLKIIGKILYISCQRLKTQAKLQASEALYQNIFNHSTDGIFLLAIQPDEQLIYETINPAYEQIIGKNTTEIIGKSITEVLSSEIVHLFLRQYHTCLETFAPLDYEQTLELAGETHTWRTILIPIINEEQQVIKLQGSIRDITKEKLAIATQIRHTRYRHLLRSITLNIRQSLDLTTILHTTVTQLQTTLHADRVLLVQFLPDGTSQITEEEVVDRVFSLKDQVELDSVYWQQLAELSVKENFYLQQDKNLTQLSSCDQQFLQTYHICTNLVLPIFRRRTIKNNQIKLEQEINHLWGLLCVQQCNQPRTWTKDEIELLQQLVGQLNLALSQAELLESEIKQRQELARSNAELEQFAYIASHDLQAPLQTISNYVQLIERRYGDKLDSKADKYINYIVDAVQRMRTQINDLLEYSRVGRQKNTLRATDCNLVLEQALANLRAAIDYNQAIINCENNLPTLIADFSQLVVLWQNLISNSIKYRSLQQPVIIINVQAQENYWQFSISDNGIGIEPQYQKRIFQIFQRLHTQEEYSGSGIGLAICQKIVERHGGRIWVESQLGRGATFYFTIPNSNQFSNLNKT
ncbi:multi-sensor signal transduction histidine kinase [Stanieria cyanosphaera PCC 7437]|uniref:histidine kinase n=1 Tax=Stanieria cyanosphaera (strain ATCC 29371 / PCC 7437) TaxID=111780 RepID=K9XX77_STAC7|nr:PAS domain S-box protein [Stanieria cyanosphaera]AFZ37200.1 multi-sensor signal transduction histidine kinase [Stanieria cyanosphaera PCC 7437]